MLILYSYIKGNSTVFDNVSRYPLYPSTHSRMIISYPLHAKKKKTRMDEEKGGSGDTLLLVPHKLFAGLFSLLLSYMRCKIKNTSVRCHSTPEQIGTSQVQIFTPAHKRDNTDLYQLLHSGQRRLDNFPHVN
ncbi:hypothetical protein, unlikely [Trypanosoma brucei gambiense DAL972]|uniref:Uncharacterized protein n=1 Tax=Trypanosoma brucei gambiense (strain MHOM/CI/86/DAL972) TaxID=679716 RepID=C9ZL66_TRYB9|nr:hypothetical protein, unlikely [Trypanosoma brucei gambiense DAL972]CBH10075.1 hypothetical protein, unlikely [Trypanosoma brucei gambiense DAL972]|eukprot:XP_011772365.1 hypothetical protein, unlikely [Trypanosoma brucei gambiense DAL972]